MASKAPKAHLATCFAILFTVLPPCICMTIQFDEQLSNISVSVAASYSKLSAQFVSKCSIATRLQCYGDAKHNQLHEDGGEQQQQQRNNSLFGQRQTIGCYCDSKCFRYKDCCQDYYYSHYLEHRNDFEQKNRYTCLPMLMGNRDNVSNSNVYISLQAIGRCSPRIDASPRIRRYCEDDPRRTRHVEDDFDSAISLDLPVFDRLTRQIYRNIYCARCNLRHLGGLLQVRYKAVCDRLTHPDELRKRGYYHRRTRQWFRVSDSSAAPKRITALCSARMIGSLMDLQHREAVEFRRCHETIDGCPDADQTSKDARMCGEFRQPAYSAAFRRPFANIHCARCNGVRHIESLYCEDPFAADYIPDQPWYPLLYEIDLKSLISTLENVENSDTATADQIISSNNKPPNYHRISSNSNNNDDDDNNNQNDSSSSFITPHFWAQKFTSIMNGDDDRTHSESTEANGKKSNFEKSRSFIRQVLLTKICLGLAFFGATLHLILLTKLGKATATTGTTSTAKVTVTLAATSARKQQQPKRKLSLPNYLHTNLCVTIMLANVTFLLTFYAYDYPVACVTLPAICIYFFLSSFLWMFSLALDLHITLSDPFGVGGWSGSRRRTTRFLLYSALGWLAPALVSGAAVTVQLVSPPEAADSALDRMFNPHFGRDDKCWIASSGAKIVYFIAPSTAVLAANLVLFVRLIRIFRRLKREQRLNDESMQPSNTSNASINTATTIGIEAISKYSSNDNVVDSDLASSIASSSGATIAATASIDSAAICGKSGADHITVMLYLRVLMIVGCAWTLYIFATFTRIEALWDVWIVVSSLQGFGIFVAFNGKRLFDAVFRS